jgi:predicted metal-dependent hydrolase
MIGSDGSAPLHPAAQRGLELFNQREYYSAHEAFEQAWRAERGEIRALYQGLLQTALIYLYITLNNYDGATRLYERCQRHLAPWPATCCGLDVGALRLSLAGVMEAVARLGPDQLLHFDTSLFKPIDHA